MAVPFPKITLKRPMGNYEDVVLQAVIPGPGEAGEPEIRIGPGITAIIGPAEDEDEEEFMLEMLAKFLNHEFLHILLYYLEGRDACDKLDRLNLILWPYL